MSGNELDHFNGPLRTSVGAFWAADRAVFRGFDLHADLLGIDWMDLYVFGITGRRYSSDQVKLLHAIWSLTSYPDSRLWNNRVAAIAASARSSPALALAAAVAVSEAGIFGGGPGIRAVDFFIRAGNAVRAGENLSAFLREELSGKRIYGYGRPIDSRDERLLPLKKVVESLGFSNGFHYRLAFDVERFLVDQHKPFLLMNYAALTAALAVDLGFSPREYQLFNILKTLAGMPPCIVEAAEKPEGALFPRACDQINYIGHPPREWPG